MHIDQAEDRHQHDQPGGLREQEELGGGVDPAAAAGRVVAPQRDQEVHRHQHRFPQEEEQEQVQRQEHADDCAEVPQQVEMEEADALVDFAPGADHRHQAEQCRQYHQHQRQAVQRQVETDAEARNPVAFELQRPLRCAAGYSEAVVAADPQPQAENQHQQHRAGREPARQPGAGVTFALPAQQPADDRDQDQPEQDHRKTAPVISTAPSATDAAYQRNCPVWVLDRPWWARVNVAGMAPIAWSNRSSRLTCTSHR